MTRTFTHVAASVLITLTAMLGSACHHARHLARPVFATDTATAHVTLPDSSGEAARAAALYKAQLLATINSHHINFNTFSSKIKLDYDNGAGSGMDGLTGNIRIRRDSAIWISVSAPVLGEQVRVLITPDSMKLVNKYDKKILLRSLADARKLLNIPFDFNTLQDLLTGNPVLLTDSLYNVVHSPSVISFNCDGDTFTSVFNLAPENLSLQQSKVEDKVGNRSCELTYANYGNQQGRDFAASRRIFISDKNVVKAAIEYTRVEFDGAISLPFSLPSSGYTVN